MGQQLITYKVSYFQENDQPISGFCFYHCFKVLVNKFKFYIYLFGHILLTTYILNFADQFCSTEKYVIV